MQGMYHWQAGTERVEINPPILADTTDGEHIAWVCGRIWYLQEVGQLRRGAPWSKTELGSVLFGFYVSKTMQHRIRFTLEPDASAAITDPIW